MSDAVVKRERTVVDRRRPTASRARATTLLRFAVIAAAIGITLFPIIFLILTSLKPSGEFLEIPPRLLPSRVTFEHYIDALGGGGTGRSFWNSVQVTAATTAISLFAGAGAGYALARSRLTDRAVSLILFAFLFFRFYPRITTVIPWFLMMREANLIDTIPAVVLGQLGFTVPFVTWLMVVFFREMPVELDEAAMVDGANPYQRFFKIALPMAAPGLASASIFTAFVSWNEFIIASSVARRNAGVLSMEVAGFVTDKGIDWGPMSATSVLIVAPMIIFALLMQRYLVAGLTLGAIKG